ncbi:phosphatase PAP2 family protein [Aequorivita sp. SDUM287046]|uniref:Phosphatase PAP2 family protein n=1 Tax=Aequorivita aurantiaca TaxID=3053356 RepID=A0ABT8DGZ1_9FLAO|nr:phosphatase PAP2 family protein [Aequorivita aurantiaca]MDN3724666.1 phosphatase PAP2 family protein [Aequorivita aurantiaca]
MRESIRALIQKIKAFLIHNFHQYNSKLPYIITVVVALIIVIGGINMFVELTDELHDELLPQYDQAITDYVIAFRTPALTQFFIFITHVGDLYGYLIVLAISSLLSFFIFKKWRGLLQTIFVLVLASLSNTILKRFIDRARPGIEHLVSVETLSYPSGHAMSAMAFYGFVIYLFFNFKINIYLKIGIAIFLVFIILAIGISRIYLGVHYPSDVAGGYIAGLIWVVFCILIFNLVEVFRKDQKT